MKTQPLALNALLCVGALLAPAFLASCREAPERQAQIRFGLFPNVTHVQGLVARHFSRTGRDGLKNASLNGRGKISPFYGMLTTPALALWKPCSPIP